MLEDTFRAFAVQLNVTLCGVAGALSVIVDVLEMPLSTAVTVAELFTLSVPAVAAKVTDERPLGTVTEAGTVRLALLLDNATVVLPAAAFVNTAVQVDRPPEFKVEGAQVNELRAITPVPVTHGPVMALATRCTTTTLHTPTP